MSLISRLLNGATSTSTTKPALESTVETQFSYSLLFPDSEQLSHNDQVFPLTSGTAVPTATLNAFDTNPDVDLELKDVRVVILQEATSFTTASLLYDSHAPTVVASPPEKAPTSNGQSHPTREGRRSISSPRKGSVGQGSFPVVIQQDSPAAPTFGAFGRRPTHQKTPSYAETEAQRTTREHREEIGTFSSCIFGASEVLAYKGTGTKVHILPSDNRSVFAPASYAGEGSLGRSSLRGSRLANSFTSENITGPTSAGFTSPITSARGGERKKVLITRMFPVLLPNDEIDSTAQDRTPTSSTKPNDTTGYPFPRVDNGVAGERKKVPPKQKKTPMYAVGLVITLPPAPYAPIHTSRSSFRAPGSYTEQESMPSSYSSTRRAGWTVLGFDSGADSMQSSYSSDVEDRIEIITQHWDIIMRTLSHLQSVTTKALLPLLRQADISSPDPRRDSLSHHRTPSVSVSISGKRVAEEIKPVKPPKTNAKPVAVVANCLAGNTKIQIEVDTSRQRILTGLQASRVVTGQGRWGIWREQARLLNKFAGGKDEGFFFFNLLTGFLGNHTEWLQALGPHWYRRRHYQQQRANKDDEISLPARTVIVSDDKVLARRLLFLLSAFLPAHQSTSPVRLHRPSTSISFGGYSQSPPGGYIIPVLREESLRRRINKRGSNSGMKTAHSRTMSFPAQPSARFSSELYQHDRRPSDAQSFKSANLPIPGSDIGTRKSSAATVSAATPVTTMPHFSTRRTGKGTGSTARPGSSGSLATDDLIRSLHRNDSSGHYSTVSTDSVGQNSRWGSMISGFWSSKRRDSSASTSIEPLSIEGLEIDDPKHVTPQRKQDKLAQMVDEVRVTPKPNTYQRDREARKSDGSATTARPEEEQPDEEPPVRTIEIKERIPDPSGAYQSPVKTSINEVDGAIEIDVPIPDYLAFETAVSSPASSGYLSTPGLGHGLESFEHYSRVGPDADTTLNVGGWMPRYHPDFALHAIPASTSANLVDEVKQSMQAEPTPIISSSTPHSNPNRWVDISSAVIADTTNFTIKHILYRRLIRVKDQTRNEQAGSLPNSFDSRYGNVYSSAILTPNPDVSSDVIDEKFIEEPIISLDETLVDAIERIIAQSGPGSKVNSSPSSRASSRHRVDRSAVDVPLPTAGITTSSTSTEDRGRQKAPGKAIMMGAHLEVPRNECKRIVLSALEEIVKEVVEGRKEGRGAGTSVDGARDRGLERGESFLREGVRLWLEGVEGGH